MSKTKTVPTEWLEELKNINSEVEKYSFNEEPTEHESNQYILNIGRIQTHIKASKYFTEQPSENVELEEFAKWFISIDCDYTYDENEKVRSWKNINKEQLVLFSEVYQAFKNRNK